MPSVRIRAATARDVPGLEGLQDLCYPVLSKHVRWTEAHLHGHQERFPDGQFVAEQDGQLVGFAASFRIASATALRPHTFSEITAKGTFANHDPAGDTLYGAEIMVHPDHRRRGVARRLYDARFQLVQRLGLRCFIAGGRIPGYETHRDDMDAAEYVRRVAGGELVDRVLSAQLRSGLRVAGILPGYLRDPKSSDYATLLVWDNPQLSSRPAAKGRRVTANRA